MKVEYLVVTQQDGDFCNSKSAFDNLLQADSQISINKDKLKFTQKSKTLEVEYSLDTAEIKDKNQRYFHIKLVAKDESEIEIFTSLVRTIRKIVERLNSNISINTLWDDISKYYITQAYPIINDVENVMRKLILKFMVVNVGMDWVNETMPSSIKEKITEKAKLNNANNIKEDTLHNADFIQLTGFLFDKKRNKDFNHFDKLLEKNETEKTHTIESLRDDYLLISNFDRYFSKLINYQGKLLEEKWQKLYKLRNQIAHNKNFSKSELEEVKKLCEEIGGKLNDTINKLDKIELDEQQKENIFTDYTKPFKNTFSTADAINSLTDWYMTNYPILDIPSLDNTALNIGVNFIVNTLSDGNLGVQIKYLELITKRNLVAQLNRNSRYRIADSNDNCKIDTFHLFLLTENIDIIDLKSISKDVIDSLKTYESKTNVFIGHIDESNHFRLLKQI